MGNLAKLVLLVIVLLLAYVLVSGYWGGTVNENTTLREIGADMSGTAHDAVEGAVDAGNDAARNISDSLDDMAN